MIRNKSENLSELYSYYKALSESIFENSRNGLLLLNKEGVILQANPAFEKYSGYTRDELEGKVKLLDLIPEEERSKLNEYRIARISGQKVPDEYETIMSTKKWEIRDFIFSVSLEPETKNIIVDLHDITDKKKVEQEKERLMGIIRHDMGNIITVLELPSQLLPRLYKEYTDSLSKRNKGEYEKLMSSQFHKDITRISEDFVKNTAALHMLFNESRDYDRIQKEVYQFSEQNMHPLVESVIKDCSKQLEESNVKVTNLIPEEIKLCFDSYKITRVWSNYILNSTKYSQGREYDNKVEIGCTEKEGFYEFYVKDNGIGIDPADIQKLDTPYTRLRVNKAPGTGLGLASIREIVGKHGGKTKIESEGRNKGTTFYFTIPTNLEPSSQ